MGALLRERKVTGRDASLPAPLLSAFKMLAARGTVGALPQAPLRKLLRKFSKNFQNFNQRGFYPYVYVVRILYVAIYKLRIPAAPRPIPSSGIGKTAIAARSATG